MRAMKGRTTSGASVWPTKILAVAESDSVREVPSAFCRAPPRMRITHCMIPRW